MKKKIFSLLLALCMAIPMAFSLVACDNDDSSSGGEATKQSTMSSENITLSYAETVYDGTEKKPAVTLKYDDEIITSDNYNVDYLDNINAGTATVVVSSKDNSSVLDAGLIFTTTFKINRAPIAVSNAAELNAAIMITDANHVIKLANNISARDAQDKVIPIVIFPGDKDIDVAIDLAGYDINSHISLRSTYNSVVSTKLANVNIFNSSNEDSVVGGTTSEVDYALRVFSNNNFNVNLENVKFKGFWGGIATNGTYCSETVVNAKDCEFIGTKVGAADGYDASVGAYLVSGKFIYNFEDCKFEGFGGYYTKTGHHFLNNCDVIANAEYAFPKAYHGNGGVITGSAIMIDSCSSYNQVPAAGYQKALTVDISGGRYVSASNYALEEFSTYSNILEKVCYAFVHVTNNPIFEGNATTDRNWHSENLGSIVGLDGGHTHVYSSTFFSNETHHYQKCDCGAKRNEQLHNWNDGEIFRVATIDNSGLIEYNCTICGKEKFESYAFGEDRTPVYVSNLAELNAAISEADINHVIVLTQDISGTDPYVLVYPENSDLNIAIDLAGYDINSYIRIVSKHNSEVTANDVKLYVYNSSESESVVGASDNSISYAVQVMTDNAYEIYFKDVTFKAFWGGIATSGNNVSETTLNAYNSKFISTKPDDVDDCGVGAYLVSAKHIYTFDNCEFVGYGAYYTKNGHHNLINCTMTANGTPSYVPSYNGSGANVTASALVIDSCEGYNKGKATGYETDLTVDIVGGTYSSVSNYAIQEYSTYKVQANRVSYAKVTIVDAELIAKDGFERAISFENTSALDSHTYANASDTICDTCGAERELATYDIWDGTIADAPLPYDGVVTITTAEQLAGFAKAVNEGRNYNGITVVLAKDINLNNFEWTPIGYGAGSNAYSHRFAGIFDGQNHIIYNLKITKFVGGSSVAKATSGVGLFGNTDNPAVIKNVIINGARVDGNHFVGALVGFASYTKIENCTVSNATINCVYHNADDSGDKAGALIGHASNVKANTISATNSVVNAGRDAGQVVGCSAGKTTLRNISASSVVVSANGTGTGANIKNEVVGRDSATISLWKGTIGTLPEAVNNVIKITSAEEFAAFAAAVNAGNTFDGYTIELTKDMDLDNIEWTPIGYGYSNYAEKVQYGAAFKGIFDGKNFIVYNLKITTFVGGAKNTAAATGIALFGHVVSAEIKNLKVTNAEVVGNHDVGVVAGFALNSNISKAEVKNASVSCVYLDADESGDKAGIIVGHFAIGIRAGDSAAITGCKATDCTVNADRDAGQLMGCLDNDPTQSGNKATRVVVSYNESGKGVSSKSGTNINNAVVGRIS